MCARAPYLCVCGSELSADAPSKTRVQPTLAFPPPSPRALPRAPAVAVVEVYSCGQGAFKEGLK